MFLLFGILYWLFSLVTIGTAGLGRTIRNFTKPLTMPLLVVFYCLGLPFSPGVPEYPVLAALGFSALGDLFLLNQSRKRFFLAGLFAFLAGHLAYLFYFISTVRAWSFIPCWVWAAPLLYLSAGRGILKVLSGRSRILKVPVVIYIFIICGMNFSTLLRGGSVSGAAFWLPFLGSLLYLISDSLLGVRNFKKRVPFISQVISATYHLAQFFLIFGILESYPNV